MSLARRRRVDRLLWRLARLAFDRPPVDHAALEAYLEREARRDRTP